MEFKKGFGHGGLPDRDKIKELYEFTRNAAPRHLTWEPTDNILTEFFWLSVPQPAKGQSIDAAIKDNVLTITTRNVKQFALGLDGRLVQYDKPLRVTLDGKTRDVAVRPKLLTLCRSLLERADPQLAYTCRILLESANN